MPNQRHKLERIDIDELFSSPVNRGMLSFLERPPEEARVRLREKQKVNAIDASRMDPGGELPPTAEITNTSLLSQETSPLQSFNVQSSPSRLESVSNSASSLSELPIGGSLLPHEQTLIGSPTLLHSRDTLNAVINSIQEPPENSRATFLPVGEYPGDLPTYPEGNLPSGIHSYPEGNLPSGQQHESLVNEDAGGIHPRGKLPPGITNQASEPNNDTHGVSYPVGIIESVDENSESQIQPGRAHTQTGQDQHLSENPPPVVTFQGRARQVSDHTTSSEKGTANTVQPEAIDGSVIGRRQKIRRAAVAQDGHSSGEQLLYQALWNAGSAETPETRVLSIGYSGMSALCKLEKSNCKKNVHGLIRKLAVEIMGPHQSINSTGTTYRIFSYKETLRRREAAGMVWVVRTSGVQFVNPLGNLPPDPGGELPSGAGGESPSFPMGKTPLGAGGVLPIGPVGKTPTHIGKNRKNQESLLTSASESVEQLCTFARSQIAEFDDDACRLLWRKCKEVAPDCTLAEIIDCFDLKARQLLNNRGRNVANPVGLMIWSVPKMFEGLEALYLQRRRARAEEARKAAEAVTQFEQSRADWQALVDNPLTSEEDRWFYRKLLGDPKN